MVCLFIYGFIFSFCVLAPTWAKGMVMGVSAFILLSFWLRSTGYYHCNVNGLLAPYWIYLSSLMASSQLFLSSLMALYQLFLSSLSTLSILCLTVGAQNTASCSLCWHKLSECCGLHSSQLCTALAGAEVRRECDHLLPPTCPEPEWISVSETIGVRSRSRGRGRDTGDGAPVWGESEGECEPCWVNTGIFIGQSCNHDLCICILCI